jgi:hypothetical protein
VGSGGKVGTGGNVVGSGGKVGSGGRVSSGGATGTRDAGVPDVARNGGAGDGGGAGRGAGGIALGSGGRTGFGFGGATGVRDGAVVARDTGAGGPEVSASCMTEVVTNDYACGSATACSACKDQNGNSREAACKKGIDCLAKAGASCNASCLQDCLNQAGDTPGQACVTALKTAACGAGGCGVTAPPPNGGG